MPPHDARPSHGARRLSCAPFRQVARDIEGRHGARSARALAQGPVELDDVAATGVLPQAVDVVCYVLVLLLPDEAQSSIQSAKRVLHSRRPGTVHLLDSSLTDVIATLGS